MERLRTLAAVLACAAGATVAGPLDPPPGPIASTMKPLDQVEPRTAVNAENTPGDNDDASPSVFRITEPGSYFLPDNLDVPAGRIGVEIACSDVTLDLRGFTITGGLAGVFASPVFGSESGVRVHDGIVREATLVGVLVQSVNSTIERITATDGAEAGITAGADVLVADCAATANGGTGIAALTGSVVRSCRAANNGDHGITAFGEGCIVDRCIASGNQSAGVFTDSATVTGCTATQNKTDGFILLNYSTMEGCTAKYNGEDGIDAADSCTISRSVAVRSGQNGFRLYRACVVDHCTASDNALDGIRVEIACSVTDCTAYSNGQINPNLVGAGIHAISSANRIEGNNCVGNDKGLAVDATDSFIARNTARNNAAGNFVVAGGNELAPIITNPGSNNFSTAAPWSNFAY
jgi:parallel beta-helix repeat protein